MKPSGDRHEELARREQELKDRELQIRLREMEAELKDRDAPIYQTQKHRTEKHQPEKAQKPWLKKAIFAGQLFLIGVTALVAIKVAAVLSTVVLVGLVGWFCYKIFWEPKRKKM